MAALDGNQTNGSATNLGSGGLQTPGPVIAGSLSLTNAVESSAATAGAIVPTDFVGFVEISVNGVTVKVPYYNV